VRRDGLRALLVGTAPELARLADALRRAGVEVEVFDTVENLVAHDAKSRGDLVVAAGPDRLAAAAVVPGLSGRLWAVAVGLPPDAELLAAVPDAVVDAAEHARWLICPSERVRGLVGAALGAAVRRSVVLPLGAPSVNGDGDLDAALVALLDRTFPAKPWPGRARPLRVVVAGHALHFLAAITEWLRGVDDVELRVDHVESFARHDEAASRALVAWADTVLCEWASPVAAWYSRNKRPGQRLVVRLHRAELYSAWWRDIEIDAVDQVVCVSRHYARVTRETTGWPAEKIVVIPNYVDGAVLDRPKLVGAPFTLGMIGVTPRRKRLDLALDLVERLRAADPRFSLHVKSQLAWDLPWAWRDTEERAATDEALRRLRSVPALADGVVLDEYGPDVGSWLRKVGWVVSLSDDESFHLAPAEGMASGAVPLIRPWPGSETIYDAQWIAGAEDGAALVEDLTDRVLRATRDGTWDRLRLEAQRQARASFDVTSVCQRFARILVEDLEPPGAQSSPSASPSRASMSP
jgi:glycosyltransferase involved in cell wall biosynthesis